MADWRFEFEKVVRREGGGKDKQSRIRESVPAGMGAQVEKAREGTESIADLGCGSKKGVCASAVLVVEKYDG